MDDLERALRAVLDDPAQMQELRELAGAMGFSAPQPQSVSATAPKAAEPEPKPKPVQAVFQQQPLPEPLVRSLPPQCCGRREKWTKSKRRFCWR